MTQVFRGHVFHVAGAATLESAVRDLVEQRGTASGWRGTIEGGERVD